jgi:hypothetical protein
MPRVKPKVTSAFEPHGVGNTAACFPFPCSGQGENSDYQLISPIPTGLLLLSFFLYASRLTPVRLASLR